mmetsp:Transcript_134401/g.258657  ORF Transcript_134401/g.258657 Transcript_134401/m.258657 type:complete len:201 (-) Transcript_134401:67-669(-)
MSGTRTEKTLSWRLKFATRSPASLRTVGRKATRSPKDGTGHMAPCELDNLGCINLTSRPVQFTNQQKALITSSRPRRCTLRRTGTCPCGSSITSCAGRYEGPFPVGSQPCGLEPTRTGSDQPVLSPWLSSANEMVASSQSTPNMGTSPCFSIFTGDAWLSTTKTSTQRQFTLPSAPNSATTQFVFGQFGFVRRRCPSHVQ